MAQCRAAWHFPKNIQWVTFDVYGTLIDWETGVADAFEREAKRDGFTIDRTQVVDLFLEATSEIQGGSYELYAEVLRRRRSRSPRRSAGRWSPRARASCPTRVARWGRSRRPTRS